MRIDGLSPLMQQALVAAVAKAADGFRPAAAGEAQRAAAPASAAGAPLPPATSVEMLVALAAADPAVERRRRQAAEADRGLTLLERLHQELVAGVVRPERLQELADWAERFEAPDEPGLARVAREIELRVRVELAKHEVRV